MQESCQNARLLPDFGTESCLILASRILSNFLIARVVIQELYCQLEMERNMASQQLEKYEQEKKEKGEKYLISESQLVTC